MGRRTTLSASEIPNTYLMEVGVKSEREQRPKRCGTHRERWSDDSRAISSTCPGWWLGGPSLTTSQASGFEEVEEEDTD